ncbi:Tyrosinase [Diplonema papillatum]|nr:Tyrosinase [Diplonema papillatum]
MRLVLVYATLLAAAHSGQGLSLSFGGLSIAVNAGDAVKKVGGVVGDLTAPLWDLPPVARSQCATSCGKLVNDGWRVYIDRCNFCTCSNGAFTNCVPQAGCVVSQLANEPDCFEEDEECSGLESLCPSGTKCSQVHGVARCVQSGQNACSTFPCDDGSVCKVSALSTPVCRKGCTKTCGGRVEHGWSGRDDGSNHCNRCSCLDGQMVCTLMDCLEARTCPQQCTEYSESSPCRIVAASPLALQLEVLKPLTGALTFRGLCYNAATCKCGFHPQVLCSQNPCNNVSCRDGYHCEASYCGGCNYRCAKDKCPARVRKAWSALPCTERKLFVRAVKELKVTRFSEYEGFVSMYRQGWSYAHSSQEFFPWHRWYLVGFENALRSLGGEFECITLPYWDSEKDAGSENSSSPLRCDTFGRSTAVNGSGCVTEGIGAYPDWKVAGGGCLVRAFHPEFAFIGEPSLASRIMSQSSYADYRYSIEGAPHSAPHVFVGGHMARSSSPEDPLFWIHHCNLDRLWALWQDYHGYDEVATAAYTDTEYSKAAHLDNVMPMDINNSGLVLPYFSTPVRIRDMMHIHSILGSNSYSYGTDSMAFLLGSPRRGSWNWFATGTEQRVSCHGSCNPAAIEVNVALTIPIWFHNLVLPFEEVFQKLTCGSGVLDIQSKLSALLTLARLECDELADKATVSEEWISLSWRESRGAFDRCLAL